MNQDVPRIVMATAWYPPYNVGGTEVYLEGLVDELLRRDIACTVLVPKAPGAPERYEHRGAEVITYPVNAEPAPGEINRRLPPEGFSIFERILAGYSGAIYHQHSWTRGCGLHHLRAAHALGLRTTLSIHVPGVVCLRGTLLRFGSEPCDGLIEAVRCGTCWAQSRGVSRPVARALVSLPGPLAAVALRFRTRLATALATRALAAQKGEDLREAFEKSERVVAVCQWLFEALMLNGAPREKLVLSRHGLAESYIEQARAAALGPKPERGILKLLYLGRWDRGKGVDVVVAAMRALPRDTSVKLTIHGIGAVDDDGYEAEVRALAAGDPRIGFAPPRPHEEVAETMAAHDVLVVPSLWLETGPLVVMEAQAAGLYILGSRLGGIIELVAGSGAGELVEPGSIGAWATAIERLATLKSRGPLQSFRGGLRSQADVATDMIDIYRELWNARH